MWKFEFCNPITDTYYQIPQYRIKTGYLTTQFVTSKML